MKTCTKCKVEKPLDGFTPRVGRPDGHHSWCRTCRSEDRRQRYAEATEDDMRSKRASHARLRARNREAVHVHLMGHPCVDCGEADPIVLEFDHVRGEKLCDVAHGIGMFGLVKLMAEIAKCDVRCANCHRRRTHERRVAQQAERRLHTAEDGGSIPFAST